MDDSTKKRMNESKIVQEVLKIMVYLDEARTIQVQCATATHFFFHKGLIILLSQNFHIVLKVVCTCIIADNNVIIYTYNTLYKYNR